MNQAELLRYSRHLVLPDVGVEGQEKLKAARVLLIGAGGLGSPAALYLAAAGVGNLGLVDFDNVDVTNLQRQILHGTKDVGRPKLVSARERIADVNPHVHLETYETALTSQNALQIVRDYDIVVDGTDNFATRYLVNDACVLLGKPNVYGSIFRFEGQASVFALPDGPCYRCLFPEPPPPGLVPSCAEGGVLGVLPGLIGTIQATEAIKLILGAGESLAGRLLLVDTLKMQFRTVRIRRDPVCPACGTREIQALIDYEQFCGVRGGVVTAETQHHAARAREPLSAWGTTRSDRCARAIRVGHRPYSGRAAGAACDAARSRGNAGSRTRSGRLLQRRHPEPSRRQSSRGLRVPACRQSHRRSLALARRGGSGSSALLRNARR
jgi:adenylyltransferase/sulfurtransferase